MTYNCKQKALFVKACVIVCDKPDYNGDTLNAIDIKKIFTSYNNQDSFEIHHNNLPIEGVSLLENYISNTNEEVAGITIPKGSWLCTIRVDNEDIQQMLLNGDFRGVSLYNRVRPQCSAGLSGNINYSDIKDAECVIPLFISFVKNPANNVGLYIYDYKTYIQKSKDGANRMDLLKEIKALVTKAETEAEAPTIVKETETKEVEEEATIVKEAETEEEVEVQEEDKEEEVIQKEAETEEAAEEEATEEEVEEDTPQEEDLKAEIEALKEEIDKINEILAKLQEENAESEEGSDKEEKPVITKSAKITVTNEESTTQNFYEMTNRDPITGKRIRSQSKILN